MARIATYLLASAITPVLDVGLYNVERAATLAAASANSGDTIAMLTVQRAGRIAGCGLRVDGTLGVGTTITAALYRGGAPVRNLTLATTAAAASYANGSTLGPIDCQAGDEIVLVVAGGNITAAAGVELDVQLQH